MTRALRETIAFLHHVALELEHTQHFDVLADKAKHYARRLEDDARAQKPCEAEGKLNAIRRIVG